ncbi:MAG: PadR family transcriptional regulator [Candidatus Thorarchaeota archaeon]
MTFSSMGRQRPHRTRLSPVQILILAILKQGPAHGYVILQKLEDELEGRKIKSGTVYPALHRLLEKQLITGKNIQQVDGPNTVEYQLTQQGRKILSGELKNLDSQWSMQQRIWRFLGETAGEKAAAPLLDWTVRERSPIGFAAMKHRCQCGGTCNERHIEFLKQYRSYLKQELDWVSRRLDEMKSSNED